MTTSEAAGLRILHLSDTHLYGDGSRHFGVVDTLTALQRVLERAAALEPLDVVVVSGDLSDDGSEASYRLLRDTIDPWAASRDADVVYAMGNHDLAAGFEAVIGDRSGVTNAHGFRFVHLDSSVPEFGYGNIGPQQLDWLSTVLAEPAECGTVVVVHHPPVAAMTPLLAKLELQNPRELLEICAGSDVRLILCGHYHHSLVTSAMGIPVVVAPGVTNTTDTAAPSDTERALVGAGFALIDLPRVGPPRTSFLSAPHAEDGNAIYQLGADEIERIARAAGPQR